MSRLNIFFMVKNKIFELLRVLGAFILMFYPFSVEASQNYYSLPNQQILFTQNSKTKRLFMNTSYLNRRSSSVLSDDNDGLYLIHNTYNKSLLETDLNHVRKIEKDSYLSNNALAIYQLGELDKAESILRIQIRQNLMDADGRAALSALLWRKGLVGEAISNWSAVDGLDKRYRERDWLLNIRHWPPQPVNDLMSFLASERE